MKAEAKLIVDERISVNITGTIQEVGAMIDNFKMRHKGTSGVLTEAYLAAVSNNSLRMTVIVDSEPNG